MVLQAPPAYPGLCKHPALKALKLSTFLSRQHFQTLQEAIPQEKTIFEDPDIGYY